MKQAIHPELFTTTVHCNGCDTTFTTRATVPAIEVEICSNCHPFYTGKQKLLDTAGRVDKFRARQAAATKRATAKAKPAADQAETAVEELRDELATETVEIEPAATPKDTA